MKSHEKHPVAFKLEQTIRARLITRKEELGFSDEALGKKVFSPLGYSDPQKKINNLLRGQTGLSLADFYILCEGLELPPDRVFASSLDLVLEGFSPPEFIQCVEPETQKIIAPRRTQPMRHDTRDRH